jgi:FKBP-type peptidyl-prolyl cis-trans isomerase (trigger factor)
MEEVIITDEDITNFKQDVLRAESELVSVDKPLDTNMLAVIDLQGWQGHQLSKLCWQEHYYSMSDSALLPQLTATLIGKKKGDSFECQQKIADTFYMEEVRGADLRLQGEIKDVLEYRLPEFDDKLVSRYGFKSVEDFNNRIGVVMQYRKDEECGRKFLNEFLAKVVADNTIELPASMLKTTADRILEEINDKNRYYGKTSKVDTKDLDSTARQSLATALVYAKLLQQYELTVEQSEVDEYLAKADEVFGRDHANEESSRTNEEMSKICETVMEKKLVATLKSAIAARRAVL